MRSSSSGFFKEQLRRNRDAAHYQSVIPHHIKSEHDAKAYLLRIDSLDGNIQSLGDVLDGLVAFRDDTDGARNGLRCDRVVAGDHDNLDTCAAALGHGVGHGGARRINHRDESHESQLLEREVDVFAVEGITNGELVGGQLQIGEANDALAQTAEFHVSRVEVGLPLLVERDLLAVDEDGRGALEDALGRALHAKQIAGIIRILRLVDGHLDSRVRDRRKVKGLSDAKEVRVGV